MEGIVINYPSMSVLNRNTLEFVKSTSSEAFTRQRVAMLRIKSTAAFIGKASVINSKDALPCREKSATNTTTTKSSIHLCG